MNVSRVFRMILLCMGLVGFASCSKGSLTNYMNVPEGCRTSADCPGVLVCIASVCKTGQETQACKSAESRPCFPDDAKGCEKQEDGTYKCQPSCLAGTQTCANGKWGVCNGAKSISEEVCDGEDNDCDGKVDNGVDCGVCKDGDVEDCYTGTAGCKEEKKDGKVTYTCEGGCKAGQRKCEKGVGGKWDWGTCEGSVEPQKETCNDKDDDCDGSVDEDWPKKGDECTVSTGSCQNKGNLKCKDDGSDLQCGAEPIGTAKEDCNGKDDDCDGNIDNHTAGKSEPLFKNCYSGPTGTDGKGECKKGKYLCKGGQYDETTCVEQVIPVKEDCNGKDDDCDGSVDEGDDGKALEEACYSGPAGTDGKGECKKGKRTCQNNTWTKCAGEVVPGSEECNGKDDDCDGTVDNEAGSTTASSLKRPCYDGAGGCTKKQDGTYTCKGECKAGANACTNGAWATACTGATKEATESCNGKDDDCDGMVDDGNPGGGASCTGTGTGKGECAKGTRTCTNGTLSCVSNKPQTEKCDGKDYDCDGVVDNGCVSTVAGLGKTMVDGSASQALFYEPMGITVGSNKHYVADCLNHVIREVDSSGSAKVIAGVPNSFGNTDGPASKARFNCPSDVARNSNGHLFIADSKNHRIRKLVPRAALGGSCHGQATTDDWCVFTIAGSLPGTTDGVGTSARFFNPSGLVMTSTGILYISDKNNHKIRFIGTGSASGTQCLQPNCARVGLFAGNGQAALKDGSGANSSFSFPHGLTFDDVRNILYVADTGNHAIREIVGGRVSTISGGNGNGLKDGPKSDAQFLRPLGITFYLFRAVPYLYITDQNNHVIRELSFSTANACGIATEGPGWCAKSFAGRGGTPGTTNGTGTSARFDTPHGIVLSRLFSPPALVVTELGSHRLRKVDTVSAAVTSFSGSNSNYFNGKAEVARFFFPRGIATDGKGNLFVGDTDNHRIRFVDNKNEVSLLAGGGQAGFLDASKDSARFNAPRGLAHHNGILYVADSLNHRIRSMSAAPLSGPVTTFAGSGQRGANNATGTSATFHTPYDVLYEGGELLVVDYGNNLIRTISIATKAVRTFAGSGGSGYADGPATTAKFNHPTAITSDGAGNFYVADEENHKIRWIRKVTGGCEGNANYSGVCVSTLKFAEGPLDRPRAIAFHDGKLYVADGTNTLATVRIQVLDLKAQKVTLLGGSSLSFEDGPVSNAKFFGISDMVWDPFRKGIIAADTFNRRLRMISP